MSSEQEIYIDSIAIVGMAGRFPGATDVEMFWENLRSGVESISFFNDQELEAVGIDPAVISAPNYVKARAILEHIDRFDAAFFGFNPREAEAMDPQQRFFLETAWAALEHAGYETESYAGRVGVYAGIGLNSYLLNILSNAAALNMVGEFQVTLGNDKDFLSTQVSYKLNLRGPSVTVQSACSTSLVAVHLACQSLLNNECDIALAGGVRISVPEKSGYSYHEGGINSPDGHCRAFDARAQGTVGGSGVGVVVLKRVADALADGDYIHAVIKGSAVNNDGAGKIGFTAPSVEGQAAVIAEAIAMAGVDPETLSYIEAHGTGTPLGDPIEIAALTQAFRTQTERQSFCAIGSVKTNIGHLDVASGVAGLIKTIQALKHRQIPPSLHFERANPQIDFANSPFYVNSALTDWTVDYPRRAGVSSLGIGGTNAHVIVEEAPILAASGPARPSQLLVLSAKTQTALETATTNLVNFLRQNPDLNPADVAYTLQVGRRMFKHRRVLVYRDGVDAAQALSTHDEKRVLSAVQEPCERPVAFMFPGQGSQYVRMAAALYQDEPIFREQVDRCASLLAPHLGLDLRGLLYPAAEQVDDATQRLMQTDLAQPALFVVEYALARLWMKWGVRPQAMIGHSIGEYVAACLAGVFSLSDALALVAERGRLMQALPSGAMLAVSMGEAELSPLLPESVSLAAVNGAALCVVSGPATAIEQLAQDLAAQSRTCRPLHTSHAFHSAMMDPMIEQFTMQVRRITLKAPKLPFVSNLTGTWITAEQATSPDYWAQHLRQPVRFAAGLEQLLENSDRVLLEVGPGHTLSTFARQHPAKRDRHVFVSSLPHPRDPISDSVHLLNSLGRLWLADVKISWPGFYAGQQRRRLPLPTYPFEGQRYWIERQTTPVSSTIRSPHKQPNIADWFYLPTWQQDVTSEPGLQALEQSQECWLLFVDTLGLGRALAQRLEQAGHVVLIAQAGAEFSHDRAREYTFDPRRREDYTRLLKAYEADGYTPRKIVHLLSVTAPDRRPIDSAIFDEAQERGFYSLLFLAQALEQQRIVETIDLRVVSSDMQSVASEAALHPEQAALVGLCQVIPQEYVHITCQNIDVTLPPAGSRQREQLVDQLVAECSVPASELVVAYRARQRWIQTFAPVQLHQPTRDKIELRDAGVYLLTGGLGGIGLVLAEYLAQQVRARLVLLGRSAFPARDTWAAWLAAHDEQNTTSSKIRKLQAIEALGSEVLILSADVADAAQMRAVIAQIDERFGALHGVIHGAGVPGDQVVRSIQQLDKADCIEQFRPKVHGVLALAEVLQDRALDFCLLQSSLSAVLGGLGFAAYAAANLFMNAFAQQQNLSSATPWCSVMWDGWQLQQTRQDAGRTTTLAEFAITPEEGTSAFAQILAADPGSAVVVSTGDLQSRIDQWIKREFLRQTQDDDSGSLTVHARPSLQTTYVAPRNADEEMIAGVWRQLLGIDQIGIHDNFFELGGHSLLAIQIISRLRESFHVDLPMQILFEQPTIADLAVAIVQHQAEQTDDVMLTEMLAALEELSEEELQAMLSEE